MSASKLDANQVLPLVLDETNKALQVNVVAGVVNALNPSIGADGSPAPSFGTEIAGKDGLGNLIPVSVDSTGKVNVNLSTATIEIGTVDQGSPNTTANAWPVKPTDGTNVQSFTALGEAKVTITQPIPAGTNVIGDINNISGTISLPTGAATSANQTTANSSLASINTNTSHIPNQGAALIAASLPVNIASDQTVPISATSLPLPTGAATSANQTNGTQQTQIVQGGNAAHVTISNALVVDGSAVTQPVSGTVTANAGTGNFTVVQSSGSNLHVNIDSIPTTTVTGTVAATQSGSWSTSDLGFTSSEFARNDYTSVNVTTGAYVQLIASTAATYQEIEIFDSSGETLKIAFGGVGTEVDKFLVFPGGNGRIKRNVPAGTRISIEAVSGTASSGEISLNLYG